MAFGNKHKPEEESRAVATQTQGGTALEIYDPGDDAGKGLENISMDERRLPFMRILDPKSPQCKPVSAGGLPGAKGGAILNTSTKQVFDGEKGFEFIPCHREQKYIRYIAKEEDGSGGGFVAVLEPDDPLVVSHRAYYGKFGKMAVLSDEELEKCKRDPKYSPVPLLDEKNNMHELVQTFSLFGIARPTPELMFPAIVSFASTQIPKYQGFIDRYDAIRYPGPGNVLVRPPLWAHRLHMKTQYESKGAFNWFGWVVTFAEKNPDGTDDQLRSRLSARKNPDGSYADPLYAMGRELYQMITKGEAKANYAEAATREPGDDEDALPE